MIPPYNVPYDWQDTSFRMAEAYYQLGEIEKGDAIVSALADKAVEYITWYLSLDEHRFLLSSGELMEYHLPLLNSEVQLMEKFNSPKAKSYAEKLDKLYEISLARMK